MDTKEILMTVGTSVSFVSMCLTALFWWLARREKNASQEAARQASAIVAGQAETALRAAISLTRQPVRDLTVKIVEVIDGAHPNKLNAEQKRRLEPLDKAFHEAVEDNLNAYEDACAKYVDGKIDKDRFKKMYIEEIRNICVQKDGPVHSFMHPEGSSKFQAIWKVYREWHIHEK
jgi:hypothetical protein